LPGVAAYFAAGSIGTTNPSKAAQVFFAIGISLHAVVMMVYFVLMPGCQPTAWTMSHAQPVSPDGSLASMQSHGIYGGSGRAMALPSSSGGAGGEYEWGGEYVPPGGARSSDFALSPPPAGKRRQNEQHLSESALARRAIAMAIKFSINELVSVF